MKILTTKKGRVIMLILLVVFVAYFVASLLRVEFNVPYPRIKTIERKINLELPDESSVLRAARVISNMNLYAEIEISDNSFEEWLKPINSSLMKRENAVMEDALNQDFKQWAGFDSDEIEYVYYKYSLRGKGAYITTTIVILKQKNSHRRVYIWGGEHEFGIFHFDNSK